ncbi:MAG: aminopeptidase P family protein [Acidimicrobiales bacterium]|nr:aminopeptidase P family protein [Acidimicrobiales bacterium]
MVTSGARKQGKIAASVAAEAGKFASADFRAAARENHHLEIGPGPQLEAEWRAAGLTLPDLPAMRQYRLDRIVEQLHQRDLGGIILFDPMNIRYATDSTNMQIWVMHNGARYCWVGADASVIVWDFYDCEFLAAHSHVVDEVRPAIGSTFFLAGTRYAEKARRWAAEMLDVIAAHAGGNARIAIDQCHYLGYKELEAAGITIEFGQEVMEMARSIKSPDELAAMRCAVHACETTMTELAEALTPGMTEREVWAMLHAGNIARAGEWIETQILASGPRTNPWMQEASSRVIADGDLVGYDTDLVGPYGMMVDISRTLRAGGGSPTPDQQDVHALAVEQIERNLELLRPGASLHDLCHKAWMPPVDEYRHYCVLFHGVGQCDEYPEVVFPEAWDEWGFDAHLEPGMVLTVESYVGAHAGGEGVKLEEQVLVTETGPQRFSTISLDLVP